MHLFSTDRPEASPNTKAILKDGSAIPHFIVLPQANGFIRVQCLLRNYDIHGGYSYRQTSLPVDELSLFFKLFVIDPEQALEDYFNWRPSAKAMTIPKADVIALATRSMEDLL